LPVFSAITNENWAKVKGFTAELEEVFKNYHWYGNLRELKNVIKKPPCLPKRIASRCPAYPRDRELPPYRYGPQTWYRRIPCLRCPDFPASREGSLKEAASTPNRVCRNAEKVISIKKQGARLLNIDRKTLYNKMSQYGIEKPVKPACRNNTFELCDKPHPSASDH